MTITYNGIANFNDFANVIFAISSLALLAGIACGVSECIYDEVFSKDFIKVSHVLHILKMLKMDNSIKVVSVTRIANRAIYLLILKGVYSFLNMLN